LGGDEVPWNPIGHNHSVTLSALQPGTYELWLRSTNADGISVNNLRRVVIMVQPAFWESVWGRLLIVFIVAAVLGIIAYTLLYIRRIKHKQRETLQAYLALMEKNDDVKCQSPEALPACQEHQASVADDPVIKRVMAFIEQNMSNSDAGVGDMAEAAATSRSGLQRKLKKAMGITPQDLLREARIKHACRLLRETDKTVAEVSYACGFTDPKYFSRCFKQSTGMSPSDFKIAS
jgi:AraC-like DNA-binding protein